MNKVIEKIKRFCRATSYVITSITTNNHGSVTIAAGGSSTATRTVYFASAAIVTNIWGRNGTQDSVYAAPKLTKIFVTDVDGRYYQIWSGAWTPGLSGSFLGFINYTPVTSVTLVWGNTDGTGTYPARTLGGYAVGDSKNVTQY